MQLPLFVKPFFLPKESLNVFLSPGPARFRGKAQINIGTQILLYHMASRNTSVFPRKRKSFFVPGPESVTFSPVQRMVR